MLAKVSRVFKDGEEWAFGFSFAGKSKGYKYATRKGATRARARLIKAMKRDSIKVLQ